jgi:rare lipoprotein A
MPIRRGLAALALTALVAACQMPSPPLPGQPAGAPRFSEVGLASWYGPGFQRHRTATGDRFDMNGLTAAHRTLPLNSYVRVTNLENGRAVVVRNNARGPYFRGRIIDLSAGAARALGMRKDGLAKVRIELVNERAAAAGL